MYPAKTRSNTWYLLPALFGIIGGIIAFLIIRKDDPKKAKNCLYVGIGMMIIGIVIDVFFLSQIPEITQGIQINS